MDNITLSKTTADKLKRLLNRPQVAESANTQHEGGTYFVRFLKVTEEETASPFTYSAVTTECDADGVWTDGSETTIRLRATDDTELEIDSRVMAQAWAYDDDGNLWYTTQAKVKPTIGWTWTAVDHTTAPSGSPYILGDGCAVECDTSGGNCFVHLAASPSPNARALIAVKPNGSGYVAWVYTAGSENMNGATATGDFLALGGTIGNSMAWEFVWADELATWWSKTPLDTGT